MQKDYTLPLYISSFTDAQVMHVANALKISGM